jgi:hypothetical protein
MYMSSTGKSALKLRNDGLAVASEYLLLLGVSMLVFTAVFVGFDSFTSTATADAMSEAAYRVAVQVSRSISGASVTGVRVTESVDIPERICGRPYVVYPAEDGSSVRVLVGGVEREAPVILPAWVKIEGFMMSLPPGHRIDYDPYSKTLSLA